MDGGGFTKRKIRRDSSKNVGVRFKGDLKNSLKSLASILDKRANYIDKENGLIKIDEIMKKKWPAALSDSTTILYCLIKLNRNIKGINDQYLSYGKTNFTKIIDIEIRKYKKLINKEYRLREEKVPNRTELRFLYINYLINLFKYEEEFINVLIDNVSVQNKNIKENIILDEIDTVKANIATPMVTTPMMATVPTSTTIEVEKVVNGNEKNDNGVINEKKNNSKIANENSNNSKVANVNEKSNNSKVENREKTNINQSTNKEANVPKTNITLPNKNIKNANNLKLHENIKNIKATVQPIATNIVSNVNLNKNVNKNVKKIEKSQLNKIQENINKNIKV